jgi:hypothetical protein
MPHESDRVACPPQMPVVRGREESKARSIFLVFELSQSGDAPFDQANARGFLATASRRGAADRTARRLLRGAEHLRLRDPDADYR